MKAINLNNVQEAGTESNRLPAGGYVAIIEKVEDFPEKEYLRVTYDIAEGEYSGYYGQLRKDHPDWNTNGWLGAYVKSYKEAALPMLKRFCTAVSHSNGNYVFDLKKNADEQTLVGKYIGLVFREEEYYGNDGSVKTRLNVSYECSADKIRNNDFKVPEKKRLTPESPAAMSDGFQPIPESTAQELPFI